MTNLINTLTSALSRTVLFITSCAIATFSLIFLGGFALLALMTVGVALIASPFVTLLHTAPVKAEATR